MVSVSGGNKSKWLLLVEQHWEKVYPDHRQEHGLLHIILLPAYQLHPHSAGPDTLAFSCSIKLHKLEWPFNGDRHKACFSSTWVDKSVLYMSPLSGEWIILSVCGLRFVFMCFLNILHKVNVCNIKLYIMLLHIPIHTQI